MSRIKIELIAPECNEVKTREYKDRNGQIRQARSQVGWLHNGARFPTMVKISVPDDRAPYAPGDYEFAPEAYTVGKFGDVTLNGFSTYLVPLSKA